MSFSLQQPYAVTAQSFQLTTHKRIHMSKPKRQKKGTSSPAKADSLKPVYKVHHTSPIVKGIDVLTNNKHRKEIVDVTFEKETPTQSWSALEDIKQNLADSIYTISTQVAAVLKKLKEANVELTAEVALASSTLYKDLVNLSNDLTEIYSTHEGKMHVVTDENELTLLLETFNTYQLLFERFKALTFNELLAITEFTLDKKHELEALPTEAEIVEEVTHTKDTQEQPQ